MKWQWLTLASLFVVLNDEVQARTKWTDEYIPSDYNQQQPPLTNGRPLQVGISAYFISLSSFDPMTMEVSVDMYMRQNWQDPRLKSRYTKADGDIIVRDAEKYIWLPDAFVVNAVEVTKPAGPNNLVRIRPDGWILYSQKLHARIPCSTSYSFFPFDKPRCKIILESYSMKTTEGELNWRSKPAYSIYIVNETSTELWLTDFIDYKETAAMSTGDFDRLVAEFVFNRSPVHYLLTTMLPTLAFVILAYFAFYMDITYVAPRIVLCGLLLLAVSIVTIAAKLNQARIRYCTGLDIWTETMFLFVAFVLVESIFAIRYRDLEEDKRTGVYRYVYQLTTQADKVCRLAYPVALIAFVLVYCIVYLSGY